MVWRRWVRSERHRGAHRTGAEQLGQTLLRLGIEVPHRVRGLESLAHLFRRRSDVEVEGRVEQVAPRGEGTLFGVGQATPLKPLSPRRGEAIARLPEQPRLADAGFAADQQAPRPPMAGGRAQIEHALQLAGAADERREAAGLRGVESMDDVGAPLDAPHLDRIRQPAQRLRAEGFDHEQTLDEAQGVAAGHDGVRRRDPLEPGREVDGAAEGHVLGVFSFHRGAHDHQTAVDADPDVEIDSVLGPDLRREFREPPLRVEGGPDGVRGVGLARRREAEVGEHAVAEVLPDEFTAFVDRESTRRVVADQDRPPVLGLERRGEADRVHDVGEQNGEGAPIGCRRLLGRSQRLTARVAETGIARVLVLARRTLHRIP